MTVTSSAAGIRLIRNEPEIGNVNEGIVERGEDTGNAKDVLA